LTIESSRQDIESIQMLRGIAASMVVFVHIDNQLKYLDYRMLGSGWLASGVDIFFVISGFIMWVSVERRPGMTAGTFFMHRLERVVPLYWLISAGVLTMTLVAPHLLHSTVFNARHALSSFLFVPARHPLTGQFLPLLIPGWTLNYEMLFYFLFAVAIAGAAGSSRRRFLIVATLITAVVLLGLALRTRIDVLHFYSNPILFEFVAGIVVGILYRRRKVRCSWLWFAAVPLGFLIFWLGQYLGAFGPLTNLIAATLIVAGALFSPRISAPGLKALGDASYSLYLTHVVTLAAVGYLWSLGLRQAGRVPFMISALAACVVGALLCYRLIERPITEQLRKLRLPPMNPALNGPPPDDQAFGSCGRNSAVAPPRNDAEISVSRSESKPPAGRLGRH
jgi:exopolysaccharide production protein ExoZ